MCINFSTAVHCALVSECLHTYHHRPHLWQSLLNFFNDNMSLGTHTCPRQVGFYPGFSISVSPSQSPPSLIPWRWFLFAGSIFVRSFFVHFIYIYIVLHHTFLYIRVLPAHFGSHTHTVHVLHYLYTTHTCNIPSTTTSCILHTHTTVVPRFTTHLPGWFTHTTGYMRSLLPYHFYVPFMRTHSITTFLLRFYTTTHHYCYHYCARTHTHRSCIPFTVWFTLFFTYPLHGSLFVPHTFPHAHAHTTTFPLTWFVNFAFGKLVMMMMMLMMMC